MEQVIKKKKEKEVLYYYDVKVEMEVPALANYRVQASSPEEAYEKVWAMLKKNIVPTTINYKFLSRKDKKLLIYKAGMSIIELIKNL